MYASSLRGLIKGILINQALRAPEFLRDPIPQSGSEVNKFVQAVGRRVCDKYARSPDIDQLVFAPAYGWLCDPYLNGQGKGPTTPGHAEPPILGQCPGTLYSVSVSVQSYNSLGVQTTNQTIVYNNFLGPLKITSVPNYTSFGVTYSGITDIKSANHPTNNYITINALETGYSSGGWVTRSFSIARSDGQPDCITPRSYTPPKYPVTPPPLPPTVIPPGTDTPNWDVNINTDGSIQFCIAGDCGNIPAPRPDGPPSAPSESPGTPDGSPVSTNPSSGVASGATSSGRVLTGIKLTFTSTPVSATTLSGEFFRAPAWVGFGPSSTEIDFVSDGTWLRSGQFIMPCSENCTNWYVKANSGFVISVQPYSRLKAD